MYLGIDCATKLTANTAKGIREAGYCFAGRYLVPPKVYTYKGLTEAEAKIITDAGLRMLTVWETTANRAMGGASSGAEDGEKARSCAEAIHMPTTGIIYFAVDFEAMPTDFPTIRAYLKAAREHTGDYEIGVYGSYRVIEDIAKTGICKAYWQCVGWSYGKQSSHRNVYQAQWDKTVCGVNVDINECEDLDEAGTWTYQAGKAEEDDMLLRRYDTLDSMPDWAKPTVRKLIELGFLKGNNGVTDKDGRPADLDLSHDMVRMLVILDRSGVFGD